ncbi:MAG TPA: DNA-formamidopyrimidine glycosylase family protein [Gaiellales bacterium]|nr:DNA-formamidopyrimidine glycosylase family protein [Gaiellales bacterium]
MPEGHSLVLAARRIRPVLGQHVTAGPLAGTAVASIETRGKHLLVHGADGRSLHVHLGMNGRVRLAAAGAGRGRHVMRTAAADVVIFGTSRVEVRRRGDLHLGLGPDLLGAFDGAGYLRRARAIDRPVAELLLDQRVLAGVGNVVRAEALWGLRQDPFAPVSQLSDRRLLELAALSRRMLRAGVDTGRLPRDVYRATGRPCPRCRTPIESRMLGLPTPRRLYWCPGCQCTKRGLTPSGAAAG